MIIPLVGCGSSSANDDTKNIVVQNENIEKDEDAIAKLEEANEYYDKGRNFLYGLNGVEIDLSLAYENFEKAVELGKVDANFYLGVLCDWYNYPEKNYELAKEYYDKCENNSYADICVGALYLYALGVEEDEVKAKEIFQSVIDSGCVDGYCGLASLAYGEEDYGTVYEYCNKVINEGTEQLFIADAMGILAGLYRNGQGVDQDYGKALEWYEKAAGLGCSYAMNRIALLYYYGNGVEQDYLKAVEWFEKAASLNCEDAMNNIGVMYYNGQGVDQDYGKVMEWYEKAADLGDSTAMYNIGRLYEKGDEVKQDYQKAMEWYEKAADLGHEDAMYNIGWMYCNGQGVEQDYQKAMEWYEKAADLGQKVAMNDIGWMYYQGLGVIKNYATALEWYEKAAALDHANAINNIGLLYAHGGYGIEQDYVKAIEWFEKAADLGNETAKANAEKIRQQMH